MKTACLTLCIIGTVINIGFTGCFLACGEVFKELSESEYRKTDKEVGGKLTKMDKNFDMLMLANMLIIACAVVVRNSKKRGTTIIASILLIAFTLIETDIRDLFSDTLFVLAGLLGIIGAFTEDKKEDKKKLVKTEQDDTEQNKYKDLF